MLNTNSRFTLYYVNVEERILLDKKYVSAIVDGVITIIGTRYTKNGLWYVDLAPNGNPLPAAHPYYVNMANSVYAQKANTELLDFLHQPAFRPTVSSRTKATNNNFFTTWPGLPSDAVQKSLQESINTARGHTKPPPKKYTIHQTLLIHTTWIHFYDDADIPPRGASCPNPSRVSKICRTYRYSFLI